MLDNEHQLPASVGAESGDRAEAARTQSGDPADSSNASAVLTSAEAHVLGDHEQQQVEIRADPSATGIVYGSLPF